METFFALSLLAGPLGFIVGAALAFRRFVIKLSAREPVARVLRYLLLAAAVAFVAFLVGAVIGGELFCAGDNPGNLCGLGGVMGFGPLLSGIGMGWYAQAAREA
jgi:hypothetical protein